jgi:DNA-binding LacI/PurR family transcriptional regulator
MENASRNQYKYLEIAEKLREEIVSGIYSVGDKIPPIRRLSEQYGVNPQTVNKATAYLASLGYLDPRQGAGSTVTLPEGRKSVQYIGMLIDRNRSQWLLDSERAENSHSKDIYFSYFILMNNEKISADFIVYDKEAEEVPESFKEEALKASGFFVQGTLPYCYLSYLAEKQIPTVLINRTLPQGIEGRFGAALISEEKIEDMVNYLLSMGHTRILFAFSREFEKNEVFQKRWTAVREAVSGWQDKEEPALELFSFGGQSRDEVQELEGFLQDGFTAAFGYNDVSALRMYALVSKTGRSIPEDFSVVGFDDIVASNLAHPPLTTIRVNRPALIHEGYRIMQDLISSRSNLYLEKVIQTELVIRKSVYMNR